MCDSHSASLPQRLRQIIRQRSRRWLGGVAGGKHRVELNGGHLPIRKDLDERAARELGTAAPEPSGYDSEAGDGGGYGAFTSRNSVPAFDTNRHWAFIVPKRPGV